MAQPLPHLHGMHQLLLCVKHQLDAAMRPPPQLLDNKVLVDKHIALLQEGAGYMQQRRSCAERLVGVHALPQGPATVVSILPEA